MKNVTLKLALAAVLCACTVSWAQIPTMRITATSEPQSSGTNCSGCRYVKITNFELSGAGSHNLTLKPEATGEADSIKVRGNSTAGMDKKPYRIKFDKKQGLFGKTPAKSWVLLANYYDPTFALNAIAFRLGQKLGLEFTNSSQFVQLYINNNYKGLYQLTEQIQVNPGRVDIDPDYGFLVEFDYHDPDRDEVKFTATSVDPSCRDGGGGFGGGNLPCGLGTFVKSPEIESNFTISNPKIKFVQDDINALMNKMSKSTSGFPTNGYRDLIDLESFAKYVLIQQLMDNFDFNSKTQANAVPGSNYAYKDVNQKLKAGPLWDFDLAAGVPAPAGGGGWGFPGMGGGGGCEFPAHYCLTNEAITPKHIFYQRLWEDPAFLAKFKKTWDKHLTDFNAVPTFIDSLANVLRDGVANNKYANQTGGLMGGAATLTSSEYSSQVSKLKTWWTGRMQSFTQQLNAMNIDTSKDVEDGGVVVPPTNPTGFTVQVARNPSLGGSVSVKIGTGAAQTDPQGQLSASANTSITLTATANNTYTFQNWTAVSGSLPSGITATNPTITFNITANVNIRANFTGGTTNPGTNHTFQVSRNPADRGNVTVTVGTGTAQTNPTNSISIASGTSVTVTATSAVSPSGSTYTFQNWTAVNGSLPAGVSATSASITFPITANVNLQANFQRAGAAPSTYTLNVSRSPTAGGNVTVDGGRSNPGQASYAPGTSVTVVATASSGNYTFENWTAVSGVLPAGVTATSASITFSMNDDVNIQANFRQGGSQGGGVRDTIKVEAEDMASSVPAKAACPANPPNNQTMCVSSNNAGITNIGYISGGNSATYNVNIPNAGIYTVVFRIASNGQSAFRVLVNSALAGTISGDTRDWDGYTDVTLDGGVYLNAGTNTIQLEFQSPINVDYFLIIGEPSVGVRYVVQGKASKPRAAVTLKASPRGFTAALPSNHGYTSYRLIDLKGREVRSGKIGQNVTDLRFDGLKRSVLFLKLDGGAGGKPLVLRAVTY